MIKVKKGTALSLDGVQYCEAPRKAFIELQRNTKDVLVSCRICYGRGPWSYKGWTNGLKLSSGLYVFGRITCLGCQQTALLSTTKDGIKKVCKGYSLEHIGLFFLEFLEACASHDKIVRVNIHGMYHVGQIHRIASHSLKGRCGMLELYRDGEKVGLMTDAESEEEFRRAFSDLFAGLIAQGRVIEGTDCNAILRQFSEVVCKLRGYKSNVRTRTLIEAGDFTPGEVMLEAKVDTRGKVLIPEAQNIARATEKV